MTSGRDRPPAARWWGRNAPLRLRLVLLVGIAMLPPGMLAFWQATYSYRSALHALEQNLEQSARLAAAEEERIIFSSREILTSLATQAAVRSGRGNACRRARADAIGGLVQYEAAVVTDPEGNVTCSSASLPRDLSLADRRWFQEVRQGEAFVVSDSVLSRVTQTWGVVAASRIQDESGAFLGSVSLLVGLDSFSKSYSHTAIPNGSSFAVLDQSGKAIVAGGKPRANTNALPSLHEWLRGPTRTFTADGRDGVRRVYAIASILSDRIFVVLGVPSSTVLDPLALQFAWGVFTPLLMWTLAMVVVSFGIERSVVRWIIYLERITSAYTAGRSTVRPERVVDAPDEIRRLGETFTRLADAISAREAELRESLAQKDMLVREIHHRVKNNLQLVISLLNLHARRVRDPLAESAFAEARGRINALATLHRRLYESENLQDIDIKWFLEDLCNELRRGGLAGHRNIELTCSLPNEAIGADTAVPLGLLVTEGITNAYKHAFNDRTNGRIEVSAVRDGDHHLIVTIKDDGVGLDANNVSQDVGGLGRSLIEAFTRQLGGELSIDTHEGTTMRVRFPLKHGIAHRAAAHA